MAGKKSVKRRTMAIVLALLVLGCVGVFAYEDYYFYIDYNTTTAYSDTALKKVSNQTAGWVQQTGASAGSYTTNYNFVLASNLGADITNAVPVLSTNYSKVQLPYTNDRYGGEYYVMLKGQHMGDTIGNVRGYWNANIN